MRNRRGLYLASVLLGILSISASRALADTIDPEEITCDGTVLGYLSIDQYHADNPTDTPPRYPGAVMEATFSQQVTCDLNLHWIQAIVGGSGTIGQNLAASDNVADPIPYLDPYKRDDNLPYYWTEGENSTVGDGKSTATSPDGNHLFDRPTQGDLGASIANNSIHFETALVAVDCNDPTKLYWLGGFTWGYTVNAAGTTSTADPFAWLGGPSNALTSAVMAFDGTTDYVGDGNDTMTNNGAGSAGYQFVPGCPMCCETPLPSTLSLTLSGLAGLGVLTMTRRKFAQAA